MLVLGFASLVASGYSAWSHKPMRIIASSYQLAGTLEYRLPGTSPLSFPGVRHSYSQQIASKLAEAKDIAQTHLISSGTDVAWLQTDIALDLLRGDRESALQSVGRASDRWPDTSEFQLYEAIAYAEEASAEKREGLLSLAYEGLSHLIRSSVALRRVATFDRAILSEKMLLFSSAIEDWNWCLQNDPSAAWKAVAQRRRDALRARFAGGVEINRGVKDFLRDFRSNQQEGYPLERIIETAIREWAPQRPETTANLPEIAGIALREHGDPWFHDLLSTPKSGDWNSGMAALARASLLNGTGERNRAEAESRKAIQKFRLAGNPAGRLAAAVEKLYAVNRSLTVKACSSGGSVSH
jgi:hypothetical protein